MIVQWQKCHSHTWW